MKKYDFNKLETRARNLRESGDSESALAIYLFMSDGDTSLDAGYLGMQLGSCYEQLGRYHEAKYWFGRAVEENPQLSHYQAARERFMHINLDSIIKEEEYIIPSL